MCVSFLSGFFSCYERLSQLVRRKQLDLGQIKVFVLDEADNMLEEGSMADQSINIKKCVFGGDRMTHMLICAQPDRASRTEDADRPLLRYCALAHLLGKRARDQHCAQFPEVVRSFASRFAPNANEIKLKQEELSLDAIKQFFLGALSSLLRLVRAR